MIAQKQPTWEEWTGRVRAAHLTRKVPTSVSLPAPSAVDGRTGELPGVDLVLRRSWWLLVGVVVGLVAGLLVHSARPPEYSSTAVLTVSSDSAIDEVSLARGAQALARLATAPGVVAAPLREAGLPEAAADPRQFVTAEAAPDAPIITLTGTATRPLT